MPVALSAAAPAEVLAKRRLPTCSNNAPARPGLALRLAAPRLRSMRLVAAGALPASLPRPPTPWGDSSGAAGAPAYSSSQRSATEEPLPYLFDDPEPATETDFGRSGYSGSPSSSSSSSSSASSVGLKPLPRDVEGVADDFNLHNPLQRMERLGTGWFGTIFDLDGVCVEYECGDGERSWQALAAEEGKPPPPLWALKKARGMKNEQARWLAGGVAGNGCRVLS